MRYTPVILSLPIVLAACGGGGAAPGPVGSAPPRFAALAITPGSGTVPVGGSLQLSASPRDAGGGELAGLPAPQWQSSDVAVATVGADGLVSGAGVGSATITATLTAAGATRTATAQVTVFTRFAALRMTPADVTLTRGGTARLTATPVDEAGNPVPGAPAAAWSSDAPSIAAVAGGGTVSGLGAGSARITASVTFEGLTRSASAGVLVVESAVPDAATVQGIDGGFSPATVTIAAGGTVTWTMTGDSHDVTWDGAGPTGGGIARLDKGESATRSFPSAGSYAYHCERHGDDGESGTVVVRAGGGTAPVLTSVTVAPNPVSVAPGATVQMSATPRDQLGNPLAGPAATWETSDPGRATVSAGGLVTGVAAGSAVLTATVTADGVTRTGTATVSVGSAAPSTATVSATADRTFTPRTVTIAAGGVVTWQFASTHNVTFSGAAPAGGGIPNTSSGTVSRQFAAPGTYGYECTLHSGMTATIVVQ